MASLKKNLQKIISTQIYFLVFDLSLDELVTNIISYGLDDKEGHEIKLYFELNENSIKCTVSDTGIEFDPFNAPEPDTNTSS